MVSYFVWWIGISLEVALLIRGASVGLIKTYPFFYLYIVCVLFKELVGLACYTFARDLYAIVFWPTELVTVVASFAVIVEIFRGSVKCSPGLVRLIQNVLLASFSVTALYACLDFSHRGFTSVYRAIEGLGRDLRFVEGALLIILLWLLVRYRIVVGRNLLGLMIGYSFWVGINLTDYAFLPAPGIDSSLLLRMLISASYTITLAIWCLSLWSPQNEPTQSRSQLEHDYEFFATRTRAILARSSDRMAKAIKP